MNHSSSLFVFDFAAGFNDFGVDAFYDFGADFEHLFDFDFGSSFDCFSNFEGSLVSSVGVYIVMVGIDAIEIASDAILIAPEQSTDHILAGQTAT